MNRIGNGWWAASGLALVLLVGGVAAQQLLPLRSLLGLTPDGACTPTPASSRFPGNRASDQGLWQLASQPYPARRDEVRASSTGKTIYVGSGLTSDDGVLVALDELYRFEPPLGTYEPLPDLPVKVDHAAFATHGDELYVIGGYVNGTPSRLVWRYSPTTRAWTRRAPLPTPRASVAAVGIGGKIYATGGSRGSADAPVALPTLEIYDITTDAWHRGPDMSTARHHHGAAVRDGRVVVAGGRGNSDMSLDSVEEFDPESARWSVLPPLPQGVGGLAVAGAEGSIIAIGGGDDADEWVTPATWALSRGATEWRRLADLNVARHGHGAATLGSTVYVFGGAPCPGYGRSDEVESLRVSPP